MINEKIYILAAQVLLGTGTTILAALEKYEGAVTFAIMFAVSTYFQVQKRRQELRHKEEEHQLRLKQIQEDENQA